jgi:CRP-like cAMP-binding protein
MSSPFKQFTVSFLPGERIYGEGERSASMFIVQSGAVRLFRKSNGGQTEIGIMEKGDFFGEMAILEGGKRQHCAEAAEASELIEINAATFDAMIRRNMEIAIRMLRKLSSRLRRAEEAMEALAAGSSQVLERRAPRPVAEPAPAPAAPEPPPPVIVTPSPAEVASEATLSPEGEEGGEPRLVAEDGSASFPLVGEESLIGRYDPVTEIQPEVDLTEVDLKRSVSRRHARVMRRNGDFYVIEEVGALNGTSLNGQRLVTGKPTPLHPGDTLSLGMVRLVFHSQ